MSITAIKKEFTEQHLQSDAKILLVDALQAPLAGEDNADVTHVLYVLESDGTARRWLRNPKAKGVWLEDKKTVVINRTMIATAHDQWKWQVFRKHDNAQRKADERPVDREKLRQAVRFFYDLQKLRIQASGRDTDQAEPAVLEADDKEFLGRQAKGLAALEASALSEIKGMIRRVPIWRQWLDHQKGCGPTLSGVIIAEVDITKCDTPSALWAYAGLHVDTKTGKAVKRKRGEKANWNPFLKTKLVFVLGGCLIKANSPWRKFYDDYKHRKENQLVATCMLCEGKGALRKADVKGREQTTPADISEKGAEVCYNCEGKKHDAPWGRGKAHRAAAAQRYMVKMFLLELWTTWRKLEGLPVTDTYAEAKLGIKHGDHA